MATWCFFIDPNDGFGCFVIRRAIAVYQCRFKQWLGGWRKKVMPELKVGSTEGSLLPAFTLHDVQYNDEALGVATELKRFNFSNLELTAYLSTRCVLILSRLMA